MWRSCPLFFAEGGLGAVRGRGGRKEGRGRSDWDGVSGTVPDTATQDVPFHPPSLAQWILPANETAVQRVRGPHWHLLAPESRRAAGGSALPRLFLRCPLQHHKQRLPGVPGQWQLGCPRELLRVPGDPQRGEKEQGALPCRCHHQLPGPLHLPAGPPGGLCPLSAAQKHPVPAEHHPLEPHLSLHPAQRHLVRGAAHHEPQGPSEQCGASCGEQEGPRPDQRKAEEGVPCRGRGCARPRSHGPGTGPHGVCAPSCPEGAQARVGCCPSSITSSGWGWQGWCRLVTAAYNYFHVTTFFWMFGEGCYLHTAIVLTYSTDRLRKWMFICIGWGVPFPIIVAWAIGKLYYDNEKCWFGKRPGVYTDYIYQGPMILVLLINFIFLFNIVRILMTKLRASTTSETIQYRKAVKATLVLLPLLGITYMLFFVNPGEDEVSRVVFIYFNSFLESFQGFFVSVFYCFLNSEVRSAIRKRWHRWQDKHSIRARVARAMSIPTSPTRVSFHSIKQSTAV
nr:corticotropin-releasing factor receptor 1 isoform X1 [Microcebus murinus]